MKAVTKSAGRKFAISPLCRTRTINPIKRIYIHKFIGLMIFLCLMASSVQADLSVTPQFKEVSINKGGWTDFSIVVRNNSLDSLTLISMSEDFDMNEQGAVVSVPDGYERGCSKWLETSPQRFFLDGNEEAKIQIRIRAPKDSDGSYFARIICEETAPRMLQYSEKEKQAMGVAFTLRATCLLLLTVNSSRNLASIEADTVMLDPGQGLATGPLALQPGDNSKGWKVGVLAKNSGNIYTKATGQVTIYNDQGILLHRGELAAGKGYVFPDRKRILVACGDRGLADGAYVISVNLVSKEGRTRRGTVAFTVADGQAYAGTQSEELRAIIDASKTGFTFSEKFVNLELTPGGRLNKAVTISNNSRDSLVLIPKKFAWSINADDGSINLHEPLDAPTERSCASWVEVSPDTIVIPALGKKSVRLTVNSAKEISGEYYAALRFDKMGADKNVPVEFQMPRVLLIAALAKGTSKPAAELLSYETKKASRELAVFEAQLKNTGNAHCYVEGSIEIMKPDGEKVGETSKFGNVSEFILPGAIRKITVNWEGYLPPGDYTAGMLLSFAENSPVIRKSVRFKVK